MKKNQNAGQPIGRKRLTVVLALLLSLCLSLGSCQEIVVPADGASSRNVSKTTAQQSAGVRETAEQEIGGSATEESAPSVISPNSFDLKNVPAYADRAYVTINDNRPYFRQEDLSVQSYEYYGSLDTLGRCTVTIACVGRDLMPTGDRGSISEVRPTGWHSVDYEIVNGDSLYNRCHLIGWQLTGENANRENLVTGTRYMNEAMIPFESMVADYIKETGNHVMYRSTPIFEGDHLLCSGILLEAYSVEDDGEGICFNVYLYNVQPGIELNYQTGESKLAEGETNRDVPANATYIINVKSKKYHRLDSKYYQNLTSNMEYTTLSKAELEAKGYEPCGTCKP